MQQSSKDAVVAWLAGKSFTTVLDAPSGDGWLTRALAPAHAGLQVDGVDLYEEAGGPLYRRIWRHDLNLGLPASCGLYDLICCCEGIEHVGNPLLLFEAFHRCLSPVGWLVVTTPNVWYQQARLQYLMRGFFPSFPCLVGKIKAGTHMHIMPWSWPQLYLYLRLAEFDDIALVPEALSGAKHLHERLFAVFSRLHARRRMRKSKTDEERRFWHTAASDGALMGRHLIVTARPVAKDGIRD